jgi:tetratricopeptide (TPR) repeat protein
VAIDLPDSRTRTSIQIKSPARNRLFSLCTFDPLPLRPSRIMTRLEKLQEMLKSSPQDPFLHYGVAMEHRRAGDLEKALAGLADAIACDANYVAAYFHQGQILAEQGNADAARQVLRDGIGIAQRTGDAHAAGEMAGLLDSLSP